MFSFLTSERETIIQTGPSHTPTCTNTHSTYTRHTSIECFYHCYIFPFVCLDRKSHAINRKSSETQHLHLLWWQKRNQAKERNREKGFLISATPMYTGMTRIIKKGHLCCYCCCCCNDDDDHVIGYYAMLDLPLLHYMTLQHRIFFREGANGSLARSITPHTEGTSGSCVVLQKSMRLEIVNPTCQTIACNTCKLFSLSTTCWMLR